MTNGRRCRRLGRAGSCLQTCNELALARKHLPQVLASVGLRRPSFQPPIQFERATSGQRALMTRPPLMVALTASLRGCQRQARPLGGEIINISFALVALVALPRPGVRVNYSARAPSIDCWPAELG